MLAVGLLLLVIIGGAVGWIVTRDPQKPARREPVAQNPSDPKPAPAATPSPARSDLLETLTAMLRNGKPGDRVTAAQQLGELGPAAQSVVPGLLDRLEGAEAELADAIAAALARIGPPREGSDAILVGALQSKSDVARAYACHTLTRAKTVPGDALSHLVQACEDPSITMRTDALRALATAGLSARSLAFPTVIKRTTDANAEVRKAAQAVFDLYQPFTSADRGLLKTFLAHKDADMRASAVGWIAPLLTEPREVTREFQPLLGDPEASVRLACLRALLRQPTSLQAVGLQIVPLIGDSDPAVSLAALTAAPHIKEIPGLSDRVQGVYQKSTDPQIRGAAAALLVQVIGPGSDRLALLRELYKDGNTEARRLCLQKYQVMVKTSVDVEADLLDATKDEDESVRVAAFHAIAEADLLARNSLKLLIQAIRNKDEKDTVRLAALSGVVASGVEGYEPLLKLVDQDFSKEFEIELCKAFAKTGDRGLKIQPWLFKHADLGDEFRTVIAAYFAEHANDSIVRELLYRTDFYKSSQPGLNVRIAYAPEIRKWSVQVLGHVKYVTIDKDLSTRVKGRLGNLASSDILLKDLAKQALTDITGK